MPPYLFPFHKASMCVDVGFQLLLFMLGKNICHQSELAVRKSENVRKIHKTAKLPPLFREHEPNKEKISSELLYSVQSRITISNFYDPDLIIISFAINICSGILFYSELERTWKNGWAIIGSSRYCCRSNR